LPVAKRLLAEPKSQIEEDNSIQPAAEETPVQPEISEAKTPPTPVKIVHNEISSSVSDGSNDNAGEKITEAKPIVDQDEIEDQ
ncbi:hypothetical protein, partial [Ochrobactrum sp. SFR4]|uniref:hypothetical protein n=1 Tax=Ochrobactrum sp. SFR4 TaxID=2717368 RepID=UPI001C8CA583